MGANFVKRIRKIRVAWRVRNYNDIEEGFNISKYETYGQIKEYWCNQSELNWIIIELYKRIKSNELTS